MRFFGTLLPLIGVLMASHCLAGEAVLYDSDLSKPKTVNKVSGDPIKLITGGKLALPIAIAEKPSPIIALAAEFLSESITDMTGNKPQIVKKEKVEGPAIYIGNLEATKAAGLSSEKMKDGGFAVKTKDGSIYLYGNDEGKSTGSAFAAMDFAERALGVRQYFQAEQGGRTVIKAQEFFVPQLDYADDPIFGKRDLWPYEGRKYLQTWRIADTHPVQIIVHAPQAWNTDADYQKNRPEIFELHKDNTRSASSPMLCYSNPKTLETYLERIAEELAGGRKSGLMIGKTVTVSPWDKNVDCYCPECRKLYDDKAGDSGSASKILCDFVRRLSDALAQKHPDLTIIYLPYLNYCDIPEGVAFPAKNVEVQLCSMPGLAMFKEASVKKHEEDLIRGWVKVSGRPIQNWHYICWPAEYTSAPYIYADAIIQHYKDTRDCTAGSFLNGEYPEARHMLSAYVWLKALWNPEIDSQKIFSVFAERMYGPAAKPMRRIIQLQDEGWSRQWSFAKVSPKNIFETSYPRPEVEEMEKCFDEAYKLAEGDDTLKKRLDYYRKGFDPFFKESKEYAEGTAFAPLMLQKVAANPNIDGKLDDEEWKKADALNFVRALDKKVKEPKYPTSVQAVWTPEGVTFGFKMAEPTPDKLWTAETPGSWHNDNIELLFDVTGKGQGDFYQIILDARNEGLACIHEAEKAGWKAAGVKSQVYRGKDFWSAEIFIPFALFAERKDASLPTTSASGVAWIGNFTRHRKADSGLKDKQPDSTSEMSRLNTRHSAWSADQSAFGPFKFKE